MCFFTRMCFFTTTRFHAFPIKILRYLQCSFARSFKSSNLHLGGIWYLVLLVCVWFLVILRWQLKNLIFMVAKCVTAALYLHSAFHPSLQTPRSRAETSIRLHPHAFKQVWTSHWLKPHMLLTHLLNGQNIKCSIYFHFNHLVCLSELTKSSQWGHRK